MQGTFRYIALGAGVQSTAVLLMACEGITKHRPDVAIFADTQSEPSWVYEHLYRLKEISSVPIHTVTSGNLGENAVDRNAGGRRRFSAVPAFTPGDDGRESMTRRQCTREYKIAPIEKHVRGLLGYKPRQRIPIGSAECWIGISVDEAVRAKPNRTRWIENAFPLLDARMRRSDCLTLIRDHGWPQPRKSSCVFCPYHSNATWRDLRDNYPEEWAKAVQFDRDVRDMSAEGMERPVFLHRQLVPLDEANLGDDQMELFGNECEGHCGV